MDARCFPNKVSKLAEYVQEPEPGLYYFYARWYDPQVGRFITKDLRRVEPTGKKNPIDIPICQILATLKCMRLPSGVACVTRSECICEEMQKCLIEHGWIDPGHGWTPLPMPSPITHPIAPIGRGYINGCTLRLIWVGIHNFCTIECFGIPIGIIS